MDALCTASSRPNVSKNHEDKAKDFKGEEPDVPHDEDDDAEGEHKAKEFAMRHGEELRRRLNDTM